MGEINKKNIDFHQTFKPERSCLTSLLTELEECNGKTIQDISVITGIPTGTSSGKVYPSICYLEYMGMISEELSNKKYSLAYTDIGKSIVLEDPGLMEDITVLLMHCMLVRPLYGADLWNYIVCEVLPKYHGSISKSNLEKELQMHFRKEVNMAPFNGAYTGIFDVLDIIQVTADAYSQKAHNVNLEYIYLYALILYEYWEDWIKGLEDSEKNEMKVSDLEITADQLEKIGFRKPFGWDQRTEYSVLEALHDKGIITLNRQMVPFAIRKVMPKDNVTELLYSELC